MSQARKIAEEKLAFKRLADLQLLEPAKVERKDLLTSHFAVCSKLVARPTFNQKREVVRLRLLATKMWTEAEFDPGWREMVDLLYDAMSDEYPSLTSKSPNLQHPMYWKALGFSSNNPNVDFQKYEEPLDGLGVVRAETDFVKGFKIKANATKDSPLSPLTSRYRGGILTQQCMLFFLQKQPFISRSIISRRQRMNSWTEQAHYGFAFIAMEVTRCLSLIFHIIHTRVQEPPNYPLQPDMLVSMPFDVDFTDPDPNYIYPMDPCWILIGERNSFMRLHTVALIVYDELYEQRGATVADTYIVLGDMDKVVKDFIARCGSIAEVEELVLQVIGTRYATEHTSYLRSSLVQRTVGSVLQSGIQGSVERRIQSQLEMEHEEENLRRERRECLRMEDEEIDGRRVAKALAGMM